MDLAAKCKPAGDRASWRERKTPHLVAGMWKALHCGGYAGRLLEVARESYTVRASSQTLVMVKQRWMQEMSGKG